MTYSVKILQRTMFIYQTLFLTFLVSCVSSDELFMTTPQILDHRNITHERHEVITEDGYVLSIFRLPNKQKKGVVVLQHSLSLDSSIFFVSEKRSIAMDVYNAGYELWLPNFRGLPLSDKHIDPNIPKLKYWDFSFHEIGLYDIPAVLDHVTNVTGTKVVVINHSLSCTASLIYSALRPEEAQGNVKVFINLAASAFMNHTRSPLRHFVGLQVNLMKPIMEAFNVGAVYYDFEAYVKLGKQLALQLMSTDLIRSIAETVVELLFGKSEMGFDPEEFPMVMSIGTQAVASKIMYHYGQLIESGRFCMYDYGVGENLVRYNSSEPPDYPLDAIRVPMYLIISDADTLSDAWGLNKLYEKLPDEAKIYGKMEVHNINHADYLVGKNRFEYFGRILKFIKSLDSISPKTT